MPRGGGRAVVALLAATLIACTDPPPAPTPTATATPDDRGASMQTLLTEDGLRLDARLFLADPQRIVVLMHQYDADQTSWFDQAKELQAAGMSALTFDFRGYGASQGDEDPTQIVTDVAAALTFVGAQGFDETILMGASMGGTAALVVAADTNAGGARTPVTSRQAPEIVGIVVISAPVEFASLDASAAAAELDAPVAVIAASGDESALTSFDELVEVARVPVENRVLVGGSGHGTELLHSPYEKWVWDRVLRFIRSIWAS